MHVLGAACCQQIHRSQIPRLVLSVVCVPKAFVWSLHFDKHDRGSKLAKGSLYATNIFIHSVVHFSKQKWILNLKCWKLNDQGTELWARKVSLLFRQLIFLIGLIQLNWKYIHWDYYCLIIEVEIFSKILTIYKLHQCITEDFPKRRIYCNIRWEKRLKIKGLVCVGPTFLISASPFRPLRANLYLPRRRLGVSLWRTKARAFLKKILGCCVL